MFIQRTVRFSVVAFCLFPIQSIFIGVAVDYKLANKQRITNKEALSSC